LAKEEEVGWLNDGPIIIWGVVNFLNISVGGVETPKTAPFTRDMLSGTN
jgi:hypothetical protein